MGAAQMSVKLKLTASILETWTIALNPQAVKHK